MKKIYLISYYFAPLGRADGVNRTYLVKYLSEAGWNVTVVSCANPHGLIRNFQKDTSLLDVIPGQVKLHPIESNYWGPMGTIGELLGLTNDPFGNWIQPVLKKADQIINEPGFLYAVVPPVSNAKIAATLAQKYGFPLIIDFRDDVFNLDVQIVQQATAMIASTPLSLQRMQNFYKLPANKGITIYNGYATTYSQVEKNTSKDGKLKIVYTGLLNMDQDPIMLVRAIKRMQQKYPETKGRVLVDFYGPSNFYTKLFLRRYLSKNVRFHGYVPFKQALEAISQADLAYTSLKSSSKVYCIPSKVFQYIAMETPILAVGPTGALQEFITTNQLGRFALVDDLDAQADNIYYFLRNQQAKTTVTETIKKIKPEFSMQQQVMRLSEYLTNLRVENNVATQN